MSEDLTRPCNRIAAGTIIKPFTTGPSPSKVSKQELHKAIELATVPRNWL